MLSLTKPGLHMKDLAINPHHAQCLGQVFINMPWRYMGEYKELIVTNAINIEIGFGAEDLDSSLTGAVCAVVEQIRERGSRITVHGPFWDLCPGSIDPEIRKVTLSRLNSLFDLVEKIRPERVVCHTGFDPKHHRGHELQWIENSISTWANFVRRAEMMEHRLFWRMSSV